HENGAYINEILKGELGFNGFVISDWEAIQEIPNANYEEQVWISVNAGVDMLMEPEKWKGAFYALKRGVENGHLTQARIDDAVTRILRVKFDSGLFEDPTMTNHPLKTLQHRTKTAKKIAQDLAEKSLVLLKNEANTLPIKAGSTIFVTGAGANNIGLQCGGWTIDWNGLIDEGKKITEGITILEGLQNLTTSKKLTIITDKKSAKKADIVLQVLSEIPYAEMAGDSEDIELTGALGHSENEETMAFSQSLNKPIITLLLAGRHLANLRKDLANWTSCIMAYLPGSEGGQAIAEVLLGNKKISGKLPMPWYETVADIEKYAPDLLFEVGYGLKY
ncbi:MAG: glycoside hydrolase family 3 C-terminal domain-containing protein, partial [Saprospiraceae bacterium]